MSKPRTLALAAFAMVLATNAPAKAFCLSPCLKAFEDGETREVEWFGELRAQEPQPLSTRRKI